MIYTQLDNYSLGACICLTTRQIYFNLSIFALILSKFIFLFLTLFVCSSCIPCAQLQERRFVNFILFSSFYFSSFRFTRKLVFTNHSFYYRQLTNCYIASSHFLLLYLKVSSLILLSYMHIFVLPCVICFLTILLIFLNISSTFFFLYFCYIVS